MTKTTEGIRDGLSEKQFAKRGYGAPAMNYFGAPQIAWDKPDDQGSADNSAADAAAAEAAAATAAAEAAAATAAAEAAAAAGDKSNKTDDEKAELLREVMDRKTKQRAAETEAATLREQLKAFEGIDLDKVKDLIKRERDAEVAELERKGEFDRIKEMMQNERRAEKEALEAQIAALTEQISTGASTIADLTVGSAFTSSTFVTEDLTLSPNKARQLYSSHFEIQDGKIVGYDKPAGKTGRTLLVNADGEALPFNEAFKRVIDADPDKDTLLRAKTKPGSGSSTTTPASNTVDKKAEPELFGYARIAAGLAKK